MIIGADFSYWAVVIALEIKQMSLDNSSPTIVLHTVIPTTQIEGTIQISLGSQEHLSIHSQAKHLNKLQILSKQ